MSPRPLVSSPLTKGALGLVLCLVVAFVVYRPGLSGSFMFDDVPNILNNAYLSIDTLDFEHLRQAALSGYSGPLMRPVSMLSLALNYYVVGTEPYFYKLTNLGLHLLNGGSLFILTCLLLSAYRRFHDNGISTDRIIWISIFVSAAWLLHPINLSSVLYVVQRMTSLSALFTLWGLIFYLWGRLRLNDGRRGMTLICAGLLVFGALAVLSKENGALLPVYMLLIEALVFGFRAPDATVRRFLGAFFTITVALPLLLFCLFVMVDPQWLSNGYHARDFTLTQRLLTEPRVIWFYISLILSPNEARMGLYHDDFPASHGLFDPVTTALSIAGVLLLMFLVVKIRKRAPLAALGIAFFLFGHSMESTVLPLELVHEHRNYLPGYGIALTLFFYLLNPGLLARLIHYRQVIAVLLIVMLAWTTYVRAVQWSDVVDQSLIEVYYHPDSPRANHNVGSLFAKLLEYDDDNEVVIRQYAERFYRHSMAADSDDVDGLFGLLLLGYSSGDGVDTALVDRLKQRLETTSDTASASNWLITILGCRDTDKCSIPADVALDLLHTAMRNDRISGRARAAVLSTASNYYHNRLQRYDKAVQLARQAVREAPQRLLYRINLAALYIALTRYDEAQRELDKVKQTDWLGKHSLRIENLEEAIAARRTAAKAADENPRGR